VISIHTVVTFLAACAVLVAVPGPNQLHIMGRGLAGGRWSGLAAAWGVETGMLLHIAVAATGLSYAMTRSTTAFLVVRCAAAGYLIYLGMRSVYLGMRPLRHQRRTLGQHRRHAYGPAGVNRTAILCRAYGAGIIVTGVNPSVVILFAVIVPPFVDRAAGDVPAQIAVLGLALLALTLPFDLMYVIAGGSLAKLFQRRPAISRYLQTLVGAVFIVLAVLTAVAISPASGRSGVAASEDRPGESSVHPVRRPPVVQASSAGGEIGSTSTRSAAKAGPGSPTALPTTHTAARTLAEARLLLTPILAGAGAGLAIASALLVVATRALRRT